MNIFGNNFKFSIFGESHGKGVGSLIYFVPSGIFLQEEDFAEAMARRNPDLLGTTSRKETDKVEILSGVVNGSTTGEEIKLWIQNKDIRSSDYQQMQDIPRPGHADFVAAQKYKGLNDSSGGGQFSGRMTAPIVAAGVIAKKILDLSTQINISAKIKSIAGKEDYAASLENAMKEGDSLGGIIECVVCGLGIGVGEPFFNSLESVISHLAFSIPGIKGIEFGSGFEATKMKGSDYNDCYINAKGETATNNSGGINGGMSNGNDVIFRVAVRPTATISKSQKTFNFASNEMEEVSYKGRHDACFALRMPVIIEAITSISIADLI